MASWEEHVRNWRNGAKFDVRWADVEQVLIAKGFTLREDGKNHWIASHSGLRDSDRFPFGRFGVNAHFRGEQGKVHPSAINDVLKALSYLEKSNESE